MADGATAGVPTQNIVLWDVGDVVHNGRPAWEVCIVFDNEAAAGAWRAWLTREAPEQDVVDG